MRALDRGELRRLALVLKEVREIECDERVGADSRGPVDLEVGRQAGAALVERDPGHIGADRLERGGRRVVLVVVGEALQRRQRDVFEIAVVLPRLLPVELCRQRVDSAVKHTKRVEECHQVAAGTDLGPGRPIQDAAGEDRQQALHVRLLADGCHAVCRQQDPRLLQGCELERLEPGLVGDQGQQRGRCGRRGSDAGDDVGAQAVGLVGDEGDELIPRHRRRGGEDAEPERDEQDHVLVRDGVVLLVIAHEVDGIEHALDLRVALGGLLLEGGPPLVQTGRAGGELAVEAGCDGQHLLAELGEGTVAEVAQAGVGVDVRGNGRVSARGLVEQEARRGQLSVGVDDGVERAVGHVGIDAGTHGGWGAADAGREGQERQAVDDVVAPQVRHAHLDVGVGRVEVADVVERDGVGRGGAGQDRPVAADAHHHVGLDRLLDQEAIRQDRLPAIRVGDDQVVLPVRRAGEVPDRDDGRAVDHLDADGGELGDARPDQLHRRRRGELRAGDGGRHILAVAAGVGRDAGDHQRQLFGQQRDSRAGRSTGELVQQHVIHARQGGRHDRSQVGADHAARRRVVQRRGRRRAVAQIDRVDAAGVGRRQRHPQRLPGRHRDGIKPLVSRDQRDCQRDADREQRHRDLDGGGRGGRVVDRVGTFIDGLEDVGADQHAVVARCNPRQRRVERQRVAVALVQPCGGADPAQQLVVQAPGPVLRQIDGIGPGAGRGLAAVIAAGPADMDGVAGPGCGGDGDGIDLQVRRRRRVDDHRHRAGGRVVALVSLEHAARAGRQRRVRDHEHGVAVAR